MKSKINKLESQIEWGKTKHFLSTEIQRGPIRIVKVPIVIANCKLVCKRCHCPDGKETNEKEFNDKITTISTK